MNISTVENLIQDLEEIRQLLIKLVSISDVKYYNWNSDSSVIVIGAHDYSWVVNTDEQSKLQILLKKKYLSWFERFSLLFDRPPSNVETRIEETHQRALQWINLDSNFSINSEVDHNIALASGIFDPFEDLLGLLRKTDPDIIIIPDTNALIRTTDPTKYWEISESKTYTMLLLSTVLAELDNLKNFARDNEFRTKVSKVIRRIKGWRNQGSLTSGVTIHKSITVKAIAEEPDFENTLGWLDPTNSDDRIIAAIIETQRTAPGDKYILVTSDINLQNKSEAAKLTFAEPP